MALAGIAREPLTGQRLPLPGRLGNPGGLVVPAVRAGTHRTPGSAWRSVTASTFSPGSTVACRGTGLRRPAPLRVREETSRANRPDARAQSISEAPADPHRTNTLGQIRSV